MARPDQALVERLFAEQGRGLLAYFRRRLRRHSEAADLAQEVYLRILRVADTHTIRNMEAYLWAVAVNLIKEQALRDRVLGSTVDLSDPFVADRLTELPDVGGEIDSAQRERRLQEVLGQLPAKCQEAVRLQYREGLSYAEIAARLDISINMVKKYHGQALLHCRRRMASLE